MLFNEYGDKNKPTILLMQGCYKIGLAVYGISQGATVMTELPARNKIKIVYAFLDGLYVAHQGKISGILSYRMFKKRKRMVGSFLKQWI